MLYIPFLLMGDFPERGNVENPYYICKLEPCDVVSALPCHSAKNSPKRKNATHGVQMQARACSSLWQKRQGKALVTHTLLLALA